MRPALDWIAGVIGSLTVIFAAIKWVIPWVRRWWSAYLAADDLARNLGLRPGSKLRELLVELQSKVSLGEVERAILARTLNVGIYCCDANGSCTAANAVLAGMFGMHPHEMHGFGWLKPIAQEEQHRVYENWIYSVKNKLPYVCEYTIQPVGKKERRRVKTEAIPVMSPDRSAILCYVGYITFVEESGVRARRALIVDDNPEVHDLSRQLITGENIYATTMGAALSHMDCTQFASCALDLTLPDSGANETMARLPSIKQRIPRIVIFSGVADMEAVRRHPNARYADAIEEKFDVLAPDKWPAFVHGT